MNNNLFRQISAGEFTGDKSELDRPVKLLLYALATIILIAFLIIASAILIGKSVGPLMLLLIFLTCVNFNNMQLRRSLNRPQIKSVLMLAIAFAFCLSFFATLYDIYWPASIFEYKGQMYITSRTWQYELPNIFFWLRYVLAVLSITFLYPSFIYLGRVITEIRYPNLPNSVRAKTGYIKSGATGDNIVYDNPDVVDFANEVADANPVDDDIADWM